MWVAGIKATLPPLTCSSRRSAACGEYPCLHGRRPDSGDGQRLRIHRRQQVVCCAPGRGSPAPGLDVVLGEGARPEAGHAGTGAQAEAGRFKCPQAGQLDARQGNPDIAQAHGAHAGYSHNELDSGACAKQQ